MTSQISSVSFLVNILLCVGRGALTVEVWSQNWGTGHISEFHIFAPSNAVPLHSVTWGACPLRPLPAATEIEVKLLLGANRKS